MPFPMKIQPLDPQSYRESIRNDASAAAKPVVKSRFKKLFDGVLKTSSSAADKTPAAGDHGNDGAVATEFEPSSVCLAKMVQNFIEENNEKQSAVKCGRNRCNCFNGNSNDSSDDEFDVSSCFGDSVSAPSSGDSLDMLKVNPRREIKLLRTLHDKHFEKSASFCRVMFGIQSED